MTAKRYVIIDTGTGDPGDASVLGPYTKREAQKIAKRLNRLPNSAPGWEQEAHDFCSLHQVVELQTLSHFNATVRDESWA